MTAPPGLPNPLGRQLAMTSKAMRERVDRVLAPHGASLTTWIVLTATMNAPADGLSQRDLARGLGIGGPAMVRHLDRLEQQGLVQRRRDDRDRRITRITITAAGRRLHRKLAPVVVAQDDLVRAQLEPRELVVLERALHKLHAFALSEHDSASANGTREQP